MIWHFFLCYQCIVFLSKRPGFTRHLRKATHHPVKQGYKCKVINYDILLSHLCCKCTKSNNNINNNKDFYSAISIGSLMAVISVFTVPQASFPPLNILTHIWTTSASIFRTVWNKSNNKLMIS